MSTTIQYGPDVALSLEVPGDRLVACYDRPRGRPIDDLPAAVATALQCPEGLPPLDRMVLPDDRVVLALEAGLPAAGELVAGIVTALLQAGVAPEGIQILRDRAQRLPSDARILAGLPREIRPCIEVSAHDPDDRECLSYLATSRDNQPVYINRQLCDADVVLPVGTLKPPASLHDLGLHHSWFPTFADAATRQRFHTPRSLLAARQRQQRRRECDEAAWLLGVQVVVQVVPAGGQEALEVLAGSAQCVAREGRARTAHAWRYQVPRRASLVIAAIGGGAEQQTWSNFACTLRTAMNAVEDGGAIVICSQLRSSPGPALRSIGRAADWESADRAVRKQKTSDALPAAQLLKAVQRARVYLLSELDEDIVENLGLAYVANQREIANLATHHRSCLVLGNAQYASVTLQPEPA